MVQEMLVGKSFVFEIEMPRKILAASGAGSIRSSKVYYHHLFSDLMKKTSRSRLLRSSPQARQGNHEKPQR